MCCQGQRHLSVAESHQFPASQWLVCVKIWDVSKTPCTSSTFKLKPVALLPATGFAGTTPLHQGLLPSKDFGTQYY
jgi:hypothetical protein